MHENGTLLLLTRTTEICEKTYIRTFQSPRNPNNTGSYNKASICRKTFDRRTSVVVTTRAIHRGQIVAMDLGGQELLLAENRWEILTNGIWAKLNTLSLSVTRRRNWRYEGGLIHR
ncbi:hypothetical protein KPH14_011494 [Odynerus spinipes]|uniref:Uncharacterized protein n=1 Tax=Odynerus spinipes TaxID=1348599 RepID=A0AAD9VTP6_9HYME|nr:hypothetical protein KPH14_011494 [Odynerus spinipes]